MIVWWVVTRGFLDLGISDEFSGTQLRRVFPLVIQSMFNERLQTTPPNASGTKRRIKDLLTEKKNGYIRSHTHKNRPCGKEFTRKAL